MEYPTDIGLVDTHAESDCGAYYHSPVVLEIFLYLAARLPVESCVIGLGIDVGLSQRLGNALCSLSAQTVDDAGVVGVVAYICIDDFHLLCLGRFAPDSKRQVGAVK